MSKHPSDDPFEAQIADNLRRAFKDKASEAVPDKFLDLLQQLRQQDAETTGGQSQHHASEGRRDA